MKQRLTALLMVALLLTMTACSASGAAWTLDQVEDKIGHRLDTAEDKVEDTLRKAVTPAPAATPTFPAAAPTEAAIQPLTQEDARKIALDHLGFTADQVEHLHTEYEIDDGIPQYDVEFHQGDWEYEFEIHAESGNILSFDKDHKHD